jgi:hypothetical protein
MHRPSHRRVGCVLIADAQTVEGLALLACKADKVGARVLAELSWRDLVPAISLPDPSIRGEREVARFPIAPGAPAPRWRIAATAHVTPRPTGTRLSPSRSVDMGAGLSSVQRCSPPGAVVLAVVRGAGGGRCGEGTSG